jgi:hypothetical protein
VESRFTVTFLRATEGQAAAPSFTEIEPLVASESARMMSKAEIMATWEQLKYKYPQQIIVVTDGKIIACSTFAVTVPRELVWLYDSAQDRLDAKIAHMET